MAQRLVTPSVNTNRPGAYPSISVKSTPSTLGVVGNVAIIGEATSGLYLGSESNIKTNYFSTDQVASVEAKYGSGPIVDAMRALAASSADTDIVGAPSRVFILQTNSPVKASSALAGYGTLSARPSGVDGNKYTYAIAQMESEVGPTVTGTVLSFATPANFTGMKFGVRVNGGALTTVDALTGLPATYDTINEMVALIDAALPAGIACTASAGALKFSADVDSGANANGFSKSFEIVELHAGDLAVLGLAEGFSTSSIESEVEIAIQRTDIALNEAFAAGGRICFKIGYLGTTASMTILDNTLTTTVTGGTGSNLSIDLTKYPSIKELIDFINVQADYVAAADASFYSFPQTAMDRGTFGICSSLTGEMPGMVKCVLFDFKNVLSTSVALSFTASATKGLPSVKTKTYLANGARGATANTNVVAALTALESIDVNFVVPLFSQDAVLDKIEGLTDTGSTYTIDSINALVKAHCIKLSTPKMKKHRLEACSKWDTFANVKVASGSLANARATLCFQKVRNPNSVGNTVTFQPWMQSVLAAGMQSAGFYKGIVHKFANVVDFIDPVDFDSSNNGDIETALDAGLLFMEKTTDGSRWVSDQTTYGFDQNFVYNSLQAMYLGDVVAVDLALSFDKAFVGKSLADVDEASGLAFLASKMNRYYKLKMIAGSSDAPAGYRFANVQVEAPVMYVSVECKLATSLYFIPINVEFSSITSGAPQA